MAVMEQRLQQIQGDPSLLMRNQFRIEEMRQMPGTTGQWQETRPW
jgi:Ca-activated chloride channel homolog